MGDPFPTWRDLLEVARFAPSPHNTQPWKLRLDGPRAATLFIDRARMLPDEDTTGCFIRCSVAMFVEALAITAANAGCRLTASMLPADSPEAPLEPFATLSLDQDPRAASSFSNQSILDRQTSRLHPLPRAIAQETFDRIKQDTKQDGLDFGHTSDPGQISRLLTVNLRAMVHDLNDRRYNAEIARWFRYGRRHGAAAKDGLEARCMGMPPHELHFAAKGARLMQWPLIGPIGRALYARRLGPAGHLGFLHGDFFNREASVVAGRAFMRFWLRLHELGITIHPFGNLVTNAEAHRQLTAELGVEQIWLVFRMGYTPPPPRSHRLDVEQLLC